MVGGVEDVGVSHVDDGWPAARRPVHSVGERLASSSSLTPSAQGHFTFIDDRRRGLEGGQHVLAPEVGVVGEDLLDCPAGRELAKGECHGDPHPADARSASICAGSTVIRSNANFLRRTPAS